MGSDAAPMLGIPHRVEGHEGQLSNTSAPPSANSRTLYQLEAANRRDSIILVLLALAVLMTLGTLIEAAFTGDLTSGLIAAPIALLIGIVSVAGAYTRGDRAVINATNARPANRAGDAVFVDVVSELALAAGIPVPAMYVIPDSALNAMATGRDRSHASIAITSGLLRKLNREELQSVVAHEISHIRNLDTRYALLVAALVGGVVLLADIFLNSLRALGRARPNKNAGPLVLVFLLLAIVFALIAPIFARLIQLAASRQREYLADASAVDLTRNPVGLESALLKVGTDREVLEVANRATQHLYFTNPIHRFEKRSKGVFSTHPSIADRVNRLRSLRGAPSLEAADVAALARAELPVERPPEPELVPTVVIRHSGLSWLLRFPPIKIGDYGIKAPFHPLYAWSDIARVDMDPERPHILQMWTYDPGSHHREVNQFPSCVNLNGYALRPQQAEATIEHEFKLHQLAGETAAMSSAS